MDLKENARLIIKKFCEEKKISEDDAKVNDELWQIKFNSFHMSVYFFEYTHFDEKRVGIAVEGILVTLPKMSAENEAELFRDLLTINRAIVGVKFALNDNNLLLSITRGLEGLGYQEFNEIMETIATQGDFYDDEIKSRLGFK